jgi:lipoyl(octanoyl) transferase
MHQSLRLPLRVVELGHHVAYADGTSAQALARSRLKSHGPALLLLEHRPTITVTKQGGTKHLIASDSTLSAHGIEIQTADRGGDVTFHGPGQVVGYPVVALRASQGFLDVGGYVRALEAGLLSACFQLGVHGAHTKQGKTGVWVDDNKLVAIGVGVSHGGVTRHGFAFNVDIPVEKYTRHLVPCGLVGFGVTSLARLLDRAAMPSRYAVRHVVAKAVAHALGYLAVWPSIDGVSSTADDALVIPPLDPSLASRQHGASHG